MHLKISSAKWWPFCPGEMSQYLTKTSPHDLMTFVNFPWPPLYPKKNTVPVSDTWTIREGYPGLRDKDLTAADALAWLERVHMQTGHLSHQHRLLWSGLTVTKQNGQLGSCRCAERPEQQPVVSRHCCWQRDDALRPRSLYRCSGPVALKICATDFNLT